MNKKALFLLCFMLLFTLSVSNITNVVHASDLESKTAQADKGTGAVYLDIKPALNQLGYTNDNYSLAPQRLIEQLLRVPAVSKLNKDGTYNATLYLNSTELDSLNSTTTSINVTSPISSSSINLASLDTTVLHFAGNTKNINTKVPMNDSEPSGVSIETAVGSSGIKACLIVAVWDYPGTGADIGPCQDEYNAINNDATGYDFKTTLVNSEATYVNVWNQIAYLCNYWTDVDVYLIGHGNYVWIGYNHYYYCCYDSWDDFWGNLWWNGLYSEDVQSYGAHPYDFSALRMSVGCCCYGWGLRQYFLNPGGSISHNRAFAGPDGVVWTDCGTEFMDHFGDSWYGSDDSYTSYVNGFNNAAPYVHDGVNFSYDDTGAAFYYDFCVSSVYSWGCLSGQGNAWDASNLIGQNDGNYAHIYGGNYGDAGYIQATMNHVSTGEVVVYGYGTYGYYNSHMYCYVQYGSGSWYALPNNPVTVNYWDGSYGPHYIDFGNAPIAFNHIAIVGYDDNGFSVSLNLDAVHVVN